jgi:kynurenine formamidase
VTPSPPAVIGRRRLLKLTSAAVGGAFTLPTIGCAQSKAPAVGLWDVWDTAFTRARFVSLSHVLTPDAPLWKGFPPGTKFERGSGRLDDKAPYAPFTYEATGVETTAYAFPADQFGTQLDPPAHWHQCFPAIDELPPTLALRKLAVISIVDRVQADANYHLTVDDVRGWEKTNGTVPAGCVLMVRSDWSKRWPDVARFQPADGKFPGVTLDALKLLHLERRILLHGHEPIDTDSTPTLIGEDWLMNNGYMQAEGVANLDQVPATGALVAIGFPRFKGGTGGFASFTAICPPEWGHGVRPGDVQDAPLAYGDRRLVWNDTTGQRERSAPCDKPKGKFSFNQK